MLKPWTITADHEELFMQHYDQLLRWALKIAGQDRQLAEDMVHDTFIQFTLVRPDLSTVQNLEGYFYTTLRNRHISYVRRRAKNYLEPLPLVDYDSAAIGLQAVDPRNRIQAQDNLRAICQYACARKETSKTGSVFILRFFHAYYPNEIALLIKGTRQAVDLWIRMARTEASRYLDDPANLKFMREHATFRGERASLPGRSNDFLNELQQEIFRTRQGRCFSSKQLKQLYGPETADTVQARALAHIVSCAECLAAVSHLLGMSPPSNRYPTDAIGPDRSLKGKSTAEGSPTQTWQRSAVEVFEHAPKKLYLSVNGFFIGSHSVNSSLNEFTVSAHIDERISFAEVFSEQGVLLLATAIEPPPDGDIEQSARISLSENRSLALSLNFVDTWPTCQLVYQEPLFQETASLAAANEPAQPDTATEDAQVQPVLLAEPLNRPQQGLTNYLHSFLHKLSSLSFWLRPGIVTATLALILILTVLLVQMRITTASAAELLNRAAASEQALLDRPDTVTHRTLDLEERDPASNPVTSHRRIELWQSGSPIKGVVRARQVYDDLGLLIAAEWIKADGSQIIYDRGSIRTTAAPAILTVDQLLPETAWRLEPSARDFPALIGKPEAARVEEQPTTYVIHYRSGAESGLLQASITLKKDGLRAIEQSLVIQRGATSVEYRFAERSFERQPAHAVSPHVFDPTILGSATSKADSKPKTPGLTQPASPLEQTHAVASAELEMEIAYLLNGARANLDEQISLTRTTDGKLLVQGVVDTNERKREILQALKPVIANPAVIVTVNTVAEGMKRNKRVSAVEVQQVEIDGNTLIPVYSELNRYLSAQGVPDERMNDAVRQFSNRVLALSRGALRHAWALRRLGNQFTSEQMRELSADANAKRLAIIREQASAFNQATEQLRAELQPVFAQYTSANGSTGAFEINNDADMSRAIARLVELASANDEAIRSAFTLSPGATTTTIKTTQFWQSLGSAAQLGARIKAQSAQTH